MNWLGELWRRLRFRLHGSRFDREMAEEMRLHLELRAEQQAAQGLDAGAARDAARRQFGNLTQMQEHSREAWGWTFLDTLSQDLRYGLRTLAAQPGFTATAVLSLVLGIGANTAIFSILNAVMLRALPVEDPGRLVEVTSGRNSHYTNPIWEQVRDHQQAFSGALAFSNAQFDLSSGGESQYAEGLWVSGRFFQVLGVPALRGRVFDNTDDRHGGGTSGPVAVISYNFWKRHYQGNPDVVGKTVRLNRHKFEIVGVTPPWFTGLDVDKGYDVAIPIGCEPLLNTDRSALEARSWWWLRIIGRLTPGESLRQADDRMKSIAPDVYRATLPPNYAPQDKKEYLKRSFLLKPAATGFSSTGERYRKALLILMATVGLVLLIACANIANLLLARASARAREFSVRMAIGAGRARIVRQLLTESLLLAILGAAGGFLLALWGGKVLISLLSTSNNPLEINLSPDLHMLAFTVAVAILTALLFGLVPALRATRIGVNEVLKEHSRGALAGASRSHLAKALVAGQVTLSVVLLVGAGLFLGTMRNLLTVDPGFSRHNVLLVTADMQQSAVPAAERTRVSQDVLARVRRLPSVTSAASAFFTPISNMVWNEWTYPEGYSPKSREDTLVYFNRISPDYFRTMQTPLIAGRDFNERDTLSAPKVMIIGESTARHFFGMANPIGKTIGMDRPEHPGERDEYQVVGLVKDTRYQRLDEAQLPTAFLASTQDAEPWPRVCFALRTSGPPMEIVPSVRAVFSAVNPGLSLQFRDFETQVSDSLIQPRLVALLSSVFGSLALVLAMVGLYGITAYAVARRKSEIGIRIALGAEPRGVVWLILRGIVVLLGIGITLGLATSLAADRLVASLLYGVRPNDPLQLTGAVLTLAIAAAVAAYLPVRRAARLDPMEALREE